MRKAFNLALLGASFLLMASQALAAVPGTMVLEGILTSSGGGAAADGDYQGTFSIYNVPTGGSPAWTEGPVAFAVKGGQFVHALGSKTPLTADMLEKLSAAHLGIKVGDDPELPRQPLHSVAYALLASSAASLSCSGCVQTGQIANGAVTASQVGFTYAGSQTKGGPATVAADLSCTGCVSVSELKFDADVDLGGNGLKAKQVTAGSLAATTVTATSFVGDGSKLTGIKIPSGTCSNKGEVVKGINNDGTLICVAAMDPTALPGDGIDEISNGLIHNQFQNTDCGTPNTPIPDNNPVGVASNLTFGDYGLAQKLNVSVELTNSKMDAITVKLYDPNNKEYVLYDKNGAGTSLKTSYPDVTKPVSGDLTTWVNKNPKGIWRLQVIDSAFLNNGNDGQIVNWCVNIQTLSSKKIQIKGNLIVDGSMTFNGGGQISGTVAYDGEATFQKPVVFKDHVEFENGWCPTQPNGEPSRVFGGVCTPGVGTNRTWQSSIDFCRAKKADLCSDAQALILRRHGLLGNYTSYPNWTNSYADNDAGTHNEATGNIGDDHGVGTAASAPCCYNNTPQRSTDIIVKKSSGDKGMRVVAIHNSVDAPFQYAAAYCTSLNADVCNKSQYVYIRSAGKITVQPLWPNDGQDTDSAQEYGTSGNISNMSDDSRYDYAYGFACCAGERSTTACPKGSTDTGGVCWLKVNNASTTWVNAALDCGALGASICTVSQSAVLRQNGVITHSGNWTGGFSDCDGQCGGNYGLGNGANNLNQNSGYGYACCYL